VNPASALTTDRAPLPRRLREIADRLGLAPHVRGWRSMADGRSNHGRTEVFVLAFDVEPGLVAVKCAGDSPASRAAVDRERAALAALAPAAERGEVPVPRMFAAADIPADVLVLTFIEGEPYERFLGSALDPASLAQDLAAALPRIWAHPPLDVPAPPRVPARLIGALDAGIAARLRSWEASTPAAPATAFLHGDLRPANILVRREKGALRLAGLVDFALARPGDTADDQLVLESTTAPVQRDFPALAAAALPPLAPAARRAATIGLLCRLLDDAVRSRDWEAFRRGERNLAEALG